MKKLIFTAVAALALSACTKPARWTVQREKEFMVACVAGNDSEQKRQFCVCTMDALESKISNAEADDIDTGRKIIPNDVVVDAAAKCVKEVVLKK